MIRPRLILMSAAVLLLSACADNPVREYPGDPSKSSTEPQPAVKSDKSVRPGPRSQKPNVVTGPPETPSIKSPGKAAAAPSAGPAVIALLEQAKSEARSGDGDAAAASLERAISIEPKNPWLWHRLAVLRLQQERWQQAVELATRSNALAADNARLLGGNWKVIAGARNGLGDSPGAEEAGALAERYLNAGSGQ